VGPPAHVNALLWVQHGNSRQWLRSSRIFGRWLLGCAGTGCGKGRMGHCWERSAVWIVSSFTRRARPAISKALERNEVSIMFDERLNTYAGSTKGYACHACTACQWKKRKSAFIGCASIRLHDPWRCSCSLSQGQPIRPRLISEEAVTVKSVIPKFPKTAHSRECAKPPYRMQTPSPCCK